MCGNSLLILGATIMVFNVDWTLMMWKVKTICASRIRVCLILLIFQRELSTVLYGIGVQLIPRIMWKKNLLFCNQTGFQDLDRFTMKKREFHYWKATHTLAYEWVECQSLPRLTSEVSILKYSHRRTSIGIVYPLLLFVLYRWRFLRPTSFFFKI